MTALSVLDVSVGVANFGLGGLTYKTFDFTPSTSYPTGGEPFTAANAGFTTITFVLPTQVAGYHIAYDYTNSKFLFYQSASHTHNLYLKDGDVADGATTRVNAGANLLGANGASYTVTGVAAGATTHGGVQGVAAAAATQVPNATDLSAAVFRVLVFGVK